MEASLGGRKHQREKYKIDDDLVCPVEETGVHNRLLTRPAFKRASLGKGTSSAGRWCFKRPWNQDRDFGYPTL